MSTPSDNRQAPVLYSFRRCPYAMRARMALSASGTVCELREVVLRDKPSAMLEASPKATVPVLALPDGRVIDESIAIMRWALSENDPDDWLGGANDQAVSDLVTENDTTFKADLDRYKYPNRYDDVDPVVHRDNGVRFLSKLDERLRASPYLCGDRLSFADVAIAPFVRQFAHVDKDWFDTLELPGLQDWLARFLQSDLFNGVMQKYPQWQPGDPPTVFG